MNEQDVIDIIKQHPKYNEFPVEYEGKYSLDFEICGVKICFFNHPNGNVISKIVNTPETQLKILSNDECEIIKLFASVGVNFLKEQIGKSEW